MKTLKTLVWLALVTGATAVAQTYSGNVFALNGVPGVGAGQFANGNGDSATFATVDTELDSWWGLGIKAGCCATYSGYGTVFDARTGSIYTQGNVGIGTATPAAPLDVVGSVRSAINGGANSFIAVGNAPSTNITSGTNTGLYMQNQSATPGNHALMQGWDANGHIQGSLGFLFGNHTGNFQASIFIEPRQVSVPSAFVVASNGNVGIGTTSPNSSLEVNGSMKLTSGSGASITFADNTVQSTAWTGVLSGGDYAESVDVATGHDSISPGDLVVIDPDQSGQFLRSTEAYSTLISGVYATKPGVVGRRQPKAKSSIDEVPMAMIGIVPTKVSTENGPIRRGDLLVSASTPGYAMKGTDHNRMMGAVIGKALAPLDAGYGVIEVLISMQ